MKTTKIIIGLLLFVSVAMAQEYDMTKTFDVGKGAKLHVKVNPGDVVINTWDKPQILVKIAGIDREEREDVDMYERSNTVYVRFNSSYGWGEDFVFSFTVPENSHVDVRTTGGDIDIRNDITGEISLHTSGGDIGLKNVNGKLQVNTSGGDIDVGNVNGKVSLSTSGGDIKVNLITGESTSIKTMGGDIEIKDVDSDVDAKTYGGDIEIGDVGGKADVTTFGGDIELGNVAGSARMETYGGNLKLTSASGEVEADTKGGDITLLDVSGSLNAKTAGGEIYAELDPSGSGDTYLRSSGGKVTLLLPSSAKADIEANIKIRGRWKSKKRDYTIRSDFMSASPVVDDDEKEVSANFSINGGGERIRIRTVNSDIVIKKK